MPSHGAPWQATMGERYQLTDWAALAAEGRLGKLKNDELQVGFDAFLSHAGAACQSTAR
jgi:hypothetical protein